MSPLSKDQERTWFLRRLHPGNPVFTLAELVRITGPVRREPLRAALTTLTARHEVLRTVFTEVDGRPRPVVLAEIDTLLTFGESSVADPGEWAASAAREPFDAGRGPLWRVRVCSFAGGEHLLLAADQLIADRRSLAVLLRELGELYTAEVAGVPAESPPVAGFGQLAEAGLRRSAAPAALAALDAQVHELEGIPTGIELPADRLRPPVLGFAGDRVDVALPAALAADLGACARARTVDTGEVLLAALAVLVHRYTGVTDIVLGVPSGGSGSVVGPASTLRVLHLDLAGDPGFAAVLDLAHCRLRDAADVPFAALVERLEPERDLGRRPVCQLAFEVRPTPVCALSGARAEPVPFGLGTSVHDLSLSFCSDRGTPVLAFEYDTDLFERASVERLARNYLTLLASALADPSAGIGTLALLAGDEVRQILADSAGDEVELTDDAMVHQLVTAQAARRPDAIALVSGPERVTFGELNRRANHVANHLRGLGVGPQVPVGVYLRRSIDMVVAVLGVLKAGGAAALLDPAQPTRRLASMLDDARAPVLLTSVTLLAGVPSGYGGHIRCLDRDRDLLARDGDQEPPVWSHPQALCQIAYTSGSTGEPRGVAFLHGPVRRVAQATQRTYSLSERDHGSWISAPGFGISFVNELWPFLSIGATVHLADEATVSSPFRLRDWLVDSGITVSVLAKALAERVCAADWPAGTALRVLMVSGERAGWLPATVPFEVVTIYGSTETTNVTTCLDETAGRRYTPRSIPPSRRRGSTSPVGAPVPNARVYVLDDRWQLVPAGVTGQIHVGGALVQGGYLHRPGMTAQKWLPDPYTPHAGARMVATGDVGRRCVDGSIEVLGRADEQISLNGYRIEPGEVSSRLLEHPAVREVAVVLAEPEPGEPRLVAYVVPAPNRRPTGGDLRELLREQLPAYMVPTMFVVLEALPMLPNGKVDRRALPVPGAARDVGSRYVAPRTTVQETLARLWSKVLRRERVGIGDNYFELGGDSLTGMELMASVATEFGVTLPLRTLFEAATVEEMAAAVERAGRTADGQGTGDDELPAIPVDPAHRHDPFPLTDIQHAYWIGRTGGLELGDVGCHGYQEWDVDGLDVGRLEKALDRLVQRHDMLRAVVTGDGRQRVLAEVEPCRVPVNDLRPLPADERAERLAELRECLSHEVLPSERWPLFRVRTTLVDDVVTRVHVSFDLLIFDARSARIFTQELAQLYRSPDLSLPGLTLSFRDHVLAERAAQEHSAAYRTSAQYWRDRLAGLPPAPELPYVQSLASVRDPRFTRCAGRLAPEVWRNLRQAAARAGITPSALLLASYAEVLATWSANSRFTVNMTLFNRRPLHPQLDDILGDFTSGLLHAVDGSAETFADRARAVQDQLWRDLEHRFVSSVQVMRDLTRHRGGGAPRAAMPVVFSSLVGVPRMEWGNLGSYVFGVTQTPQVALDHQVMEVDDGLDYAWDAVAALFPVGLVEEMAAACGRLLHGLATDESLWRQTRPVRLPAAQLAVRRAVDATEEPIPAGLLHEPALRQVALRPDATAVIDGDRTITYGELDRISAGVAARLASLGAGPDRLVGVLMHKGWEQVAAVLGVLRAGAAYLPIDPALPAERIRYLVENGQVAAVLVQPTVATEAVRPGVAAVVVDADVSAPEQPDQREQPTPADPADLAYVIYTSGSTGEPKGVMIEHRAALNTVLDINRRFGIGPDDRVLAVSSLSFDLSVWDVFGVLGAGGALVMPPASANPEPRAWSGLLRTHAVTIWNSAPALLQILAEYARGRGDRLAASLRTVLLSGDWIPPTMYDHLRELAPAARLISLGGATEASIWSIVHEVGAARPDWVSVPYGRPLANQRWYVLDDRLHPRPDWVTGGLYIAGTGLARGYWRDETKTGARFIVDPHTGGRLYRTGDLGRYRPGGDLEILGREDFQVKILGHRVELGEIETALQAHEQVAACCVVAVGERRSALRLVAHVVPEPGTAPTAEELRDFLGARLLADIVPSLYRLTPALPLTPNGKVDRGALIALGLPTADGDAVGERVEEPSTPTEALLLRVAGEVLGGVAIGPEDNFFRAGGDSLRAIAVINDAAEAGLEVPVELFFGHPTMRALAAELDVAGRGIGGPTVLDLRGDARR
jgi:amino acid adenylation domain-containing protein